jgi:hypothetical protein
MLYVSKSGGYVMATKLTLSMDEDLIRFAHELAREKNESISSIVAAYFRGLRKKKEPYVPRDPLVRKLYGMGRHIHIPKDKQGIREEMLQRHLR